MVVDRAILQTSTDDTKSILPHRILFSDDARINYSRAQAQPHRNNALPSLVYPIVYYIISWHTCLTSCNRCGWLKQQNASYSTGSLAARRGRRRGAVTGDEVGPHPTNAMFDFLTSAIDSRLVISGAQWGVL